MKIGFNTTSSRKNARVVLDINGKKIFEQRIDIDPSHPFMKEISIPDDIKESDVKITLFTSDGRELISYQPVEKKNMPFPEVTKPPKSPEEIGYNRRIVSNRVAHCTIP